jgi:outer membrane protein assembly factor BamB
MEQAAGTRSPYLYPAGNESLPAELETQAAAEFSVATLGDLGVSALVTGADSFSPAILFIPFSTEGTRGIDAYSVRMFRRESEDQPLVPVWNSGVNVGLGYAWAKITQPGEYAPIGLPRDVLFREALRTLAQQRRYASSEAEGRTAAEAVLDPLLTAPEEQIEAIRRALATAEVQLSLLPMSEYPIRVGRGGHLNSFHMPKGMESGQVRDRLRELVDSGQPLPEEHLFFRPELADRVWRPGPQQSSSGPVLEPPRNLPRLWPWPLPRPWPLPLPWPPPWFCWFFSQDWPMYQHDGNHSGHASGCSGIISTSVGGLTLRRVVPLDGNTWSSPAVAAGKIYVGVTYGPGGIGRLYKIDLLSGTVENTFDTPARTGYAPGIGGTPAVSGGRVYISNIPGTVHCLDAATLSEIWRLDLRAPDPAKNHPIVNPEADCWTGPVVANNRVYIGCGEGEFGAYGFVYCLDAATGDVIWVFSTNKSSPMADNSPNAIPHSAAMSDPLPAWAQAAGFTIVPDPPAPGCSVWSSPAYDWVTNRIFVGTGNATYGDSNPLPDTLYGSGVLALDASSGTFAGFYEPPASDCYRPNDTDVDVCGSPVVFSRAGGRYVAIGSKSGAFWIFDATTMEKVAFRQLLPYIDDDSGQPVAAIDAHPMPMENMFGVFATPAAHYGLGRLFVGLGGYSGCDSATTPFMRVVDWETLDDAWFTVAGGDGVRRYVTPSPPMYGTPNEVGLSSPAVVNDVVFIGTTRPAVYAFDAQCGHCLWSDTSFTGDYVMGTTICGNSVVVAAGGTVRVYSI